MRSLKFILQDEFEDWREGEMLLQSLIETPEEVERGREPAAELEQLVLAAGGITGPGTLGDRRRSRARDASGGGSSRMKKILPAEELARDSRFVRVADPGRDHGSAPDEGSAERNTGSAKLEPDRPAAADRARQLMHGIFMGEIQALEGAGRTTFDFDDEDVPFQLKLDMARQCWDESRHCEISVKLAEHMGTEIGEFTEATFLYEAACADRRRCCASPA